MWLTPGKCFLEIPIDSQDHYKEGRYGSYENVKKHLDGPYVVYLLSIIQRLYSDFLMTLETDLNTPNILEAKSFDSQA